MQTMVSAEWQAAFPGAVAGFLAMDGVENPRQHPGLREYVRGVEGAIRARLAGIEAPAVAALPELQAYRSHYRRFGKSYHVELQLESLLLKGKPLASPAALVEAMFAAELNNLLLTAGHDLDAVVGPITVDVSRGGEEYVGISGREVRLKPGDMYMRDGAGILSSIIYGSDQRTRLTAGTRRALFTVYAPAGIGRAAVRHHLEEIAHGVRLIAPGAAIRALESHSAS